MVFKNFRIPKSRSEKIQNWMDKETTVVVDGFSDWVILCIIFKKYSLLVGTILKYSLLVGTQYFLHKIESRYGVFNYSKSMR